MIERYVFIKLEPDHASPEETMALAAHTREVLATIPGVESVTVGTAGDAAAARAWDLSITARFANGAAVDAYLAHPDHRHYVDEVLAPRMTVIKAWNMAIG